MTRVIDDYEFLTVSGRFLPETTKNYDAVVFAS